MRRIKSLMLADLAALLRLQDRFLASSSRFPASSSGSSSNITEVSRQGLQDLTAAAAAEVQQTEQQQAAAARARSRDTQQQTVVNPLLLQAASGRFFADRPQVLQLVREAEQQLQAAAAACPSLQHVEQQVQEGLLAEQHMLQDDCAPASVRDNNASRSSSTVGDSSSSTVRNASHKPASANSSADARGTLHDSSMSCREQFDSSAGQGAAGSGCGTTGSLDSAVFQQLVELEAELQSAGGWQSLTPHMLSCMKERSVQPGSVDAAVLRFWQQRL
jgi:hypothetical protein